jgi:CheY-like chemotaxis protein
VSAKKKVLIVDDEKDLVEMLAMRLEADGRYQVGKAFDGEQALKAAAELEPDVIVLDTVMPGLDGWQVARRLRDDGRTKDAAVVIMTAGAPAESKRRADEVGADRLVLKPYDQKELVGVIREVGRRP